jgi:hypothetical protein
MESSTSSSARSLWPWMNSQRGRSGTLRRTSICASLTLTLPAAVPVVLCGPWAAGLTGGP